MTDEEYRSHFYTSIFMVVTSFIMVPFMMDLPYEHNAPPACDTVHSIEPVLSGKVIPIIKPHEIGWRFYARTRACIAEIGNTENKEEIGYLISPMTGGGTKMSGFTVDIAPADFVRTHYIGFDKTKKEFDHPPPFDVP